MTYVASTQDKMTDRDTATEPHKATHTATCHAVLSVWGRDESSPAAYRYICAFAFLSHIHSCSNPLSFVLLLPLLHYDIITTWHTHMSSSKPAPAHIPREIPSRTDLWLRCPLYSTIATHKGSAKTKGEYYEVGR